MDLINIITFNASLHVISVELCSTESVEFTLTTFNSLCDEEMTPHINIFIMQIFMDMFFSIHHFKLYIGFYKHLLIYLQIKMVGIQKLISSNNVLNESIYTCCLMTSYQYGSVKNS